MGAAAQHRFLKPYNIMFNRLVFTLSFPLTAAHAAHTQQPCSYETLMKEGRAFLNKKTPEFRRALQNFNAARTCYPTQSAAVKVNKLLGAIEKQRHQSIEQFARLNWGFEKFDDVGFVW